MLGVFREVLEGFREPCRPEACIQPGAHPCKARAPDTAPPPTLFYAGGRAMVPRIHRILQGTYVLKEVNNSCAELALRVFPTLAVWFHDQSLLLFPPPHTAPAHSFQAETTQDLGLHFPSCFFIRIHPSSRKLLCLLHSECEIFLF